jgi:cobalamin 5'-phosphate synthase/cobalamin synthase
VSRRRLAEELALLATAAQFLTRIPLPAADHFTEQRLAAAPRYFPLVGALVGALCAGVYIAALAVFPASVAVLLALAAGLLITGAFHEDGLADTFDGLGGGDRALDVMRDSRIGTYGAVALLSVLALKCAALIALPPLAVFTALVVAHGLSRLSAVLVIVSSRYLRDEGTGKPTAPRSRWNRAAAGAGHGRAAAGGLRPDPGARRRAVLHRRRRRESCPHASPVRAPPRRLHRRHAGAPCSRPASWASTSPSWPGTERGLPAPP